MGKEQKRNKSNILLLTGCCTRRYDLRVTVAAGKVLAAWQQEGVRQMWKMVKVVILWMVMVVGEGFLGSAVGEEECVQFAAGRQVGVLESAMISEASGMAASRKNAGVFWVHNDSGDIGRVFAINGKGEVLGVYELAGVLARDFEDIAVGPGPEPNENYLYVGDTGDNEKEFN